MIKSSVGHLQASDSILAYYIGKDFSRKQALGLEEYRMLTSSYEAVATELRSALLPEVKQKLLLHALENRKWLCRYLTLSTARERMYYRDSLMAQNVVWLKKNLYPQNKIALWAANTHVAGQRPAGRQPQWMGDWLAGYFNGAYYPISFQKGSFAGAELLSQDAGIRYGSQKDNFSAYIVLNKLRKIPSNQWRTPCE